MAKQRQNWMSSVITTSLQTVSLASSTRFSWKYVMCHCNGWFFDKRFRFIPFPNFTLAPFSPSFLSQFVYKNSWAQQPVELVQVNTLKIIPNHFSPGHQHQTCLRQWQVRSISRHVSWCRKTADYQDPVSPSQLYQSWMENTPTQRWSNSGQLQGNLAACQRSYSCFLRAFVYPKQEIKVLLNTSLSRCKPKHVFPFLFSLSFNSNCNNKWLYLSLNVFSALALIGDILEARIGIWKCWFLRGGYIVGRRALSPFRHPCSPQE